MASKRRQRRRTCGDKQCYPDKSTAIGVSRQILHLYGDRLNAYACPYCTHWHLGHLPQRVRQEIRARGNNG